MSKIKKDNTNVFDKMPDIFNYSAKSFGLPKELKGRGVKIAIIDSGRPNHKDIKAEITDCIDVSVESKSCIDDERGHSTMVSGLIGSNNPTALIGIAPESSLLFAKVTNKNGESSLNSIVSGILWAVVKEVDVILIPLGCDTHYMLLHDAIKKASQSGICIVAAYKEGKTEYPANYDEVLSVKVSKSKRTKKLGGTNSTSKEISFKDQDFYTTYLNQKYIQTSGSSLTSSLSAGLCALIIEQHRLNKEKFTPKKIYSEIAKLQFLNNL
jgi:subtilisin family serine protease